MSHLNGKPDIHLVVITSVINPVTAKTVYNMNERFDQLLISIDSVKTKIPNCLILVLEGCKYSQHMETTILNSNALIVYIDVINLEKQYGEANLLRSFFTSTIFNDFKMNYNILSINKLSGRYYLNEAFSFHYDNETCIARLIEPGKTWTSYGVIDTIFYSLPFKYYNNFIDGINKCCESIFIDIEHSFYLYNIIPLDKINHSINPMNVCGHMAPFGTFISI